MGIDEVGIDKVGIDEVGRYRHGLVRSVLCLLYEICVLQATNAAKPWQRDFELVRFLAGYSFLHCRAGLIWLKNEARAKLRRWSIQ